jgi:hypothetical protein
MGTPQFAVSWAEMGHLGTPFVTSVQGGGSLWNLALNL